MHQPSAELIARCLLMYEDRLRSLATDADPSWLDGFGIAHAARALSPDERAAQGRKLAAAGGIERLVITEITDVPVVFGLLPPPQVRHLLRCRYVFRHRGVLRTWIDKARRGRLGMAVPDPAMLRMLLLAEGEASVARGSAQIEADWHNAEVEGLGILAADHDWSVHPSMRLASMLYPIGALSRREGDFTGSGSVERDGFIALLPRLLPEVSWLFG